MKPTSIAIVLAVVVIFFVANLAIGGTFNNLGGDGRSLRWDRFDVLIDNIRTSQNLFDVTESYQITISKGPFSFGTAEIPLGRTTGINNVSVTVDGTALNPTCSELQGTYCATSDSKNISIKYYFPRTAFDGDRRNIRIKYTVSGALRTYKDGDQLYWVAVPKDRPFPVVASQVSVVVPNGLQILKDSQLSQQLEGKRSGKHDHLDLPRTHQDRRSDGSPRAVPARSPHEKTGLAGSL